MSLKDDNKRLRKKCNELLTKLCLVRNELAVAQRIISQTQDLVIEREVATVELLTDEEIAEARTKLHTAFAKEMGPDWAEAAMTGVYPTPR